MPNDESDLDLLVVMDSYKEKDLHSLLVSGHRVLVGLRFSKGKKCLLFEYV